MRIVPLAALSLTLAFAAGCDPETEPVGDDPALEQQPGGMDDTTYTPPEPPPAQEPPPSAQQPDATGQADRTTSFDPAQPDTTRPQAGATRPQAGTTRPQAGTRPDFGAVTPPSVAQENDADKDQDGQPDEPTGDAANGADQERQKQIAPAVEERPADSLPDQENGDDD